VALVLGSALALAGGALLVVGWWGVSGESAVALQLPYLASSTLPGAALLVAGAVIASAWWRAPVDPRVDTLYALLTEAAPPAPGAGIGDTAARVTVEGGSLVHRATCPLAAGKTVTAVTASAAEALEPCPVCLAGP
jgi:hypothetical protein